MGQLSNYLHTVRYLRPSQIYHQLWNRAFAARPTQPVRHAPNLRDGVSGFGYLTPFAGRVSGDSEFCFLNVAHSGAKTGMVDWAATQMPKLWRYNLHYFDYLLDLTLPSEQKAALINDWIGQCPPGMPDAWEAYPVSLRIVNWVKWLLVAPRSARSAAWDASLYSQARWLNSNLEYHLLANHLLKNAVALFFAGAYFSEAEADTWLTRGWSLLRQELTEQFLPDGGHYERSPMYHSLCVVDYLDVLALIGSSTALSSLEGMSKMQTRLVTIVDFLRDIALPDGEIPLFNDAAFGIAPVPQRVLDYAERVLEHSFAAEAPAHLSILDKPDSGYYGWRVNRDMLVVDCGAIGPDWQPGHAHCDTLSYELVLNGKRVVIDSGVYDYEAGPRRLLARGTAAHNTIMLDGREQSELWGVFRVARRARPINPSINLAGEGVVFEGAHDGYRRINGHPVHRRRIEFDGARMIEVIDEIRGTGQHRAQSRVRLHPDYEVVMNNDYATVRDASGQPIVRIEWYGVDTIEIEKGWYFPRFGVEQPCIALLMTRNASAPFRFGYRIRKVS